MENKSSKEYVAELLKQLEELKQKKAHKERKLQKLKTSALADHQKEQAQRNSLASIPKTSNRHYSLEDSSGLADFDKCDYDLPKYENCPPLNISECTKTDCVDTEKDKENYSVDRIVSANMDQLKLKKNFMKNSDLKSLKCNKSDREYFTETVYSNVLSFEEYDCKHFNETCGALTVSTSGKSIILDESRDKENNSNDPLSHDGDNCSTEKSYLEVYEHKCNENVSLDVREANRKTELSQDSEIICSSISIVKDIPLNNSFYDGPKRDNSSNKTLFDTRDKSSDILDDSLNSNMSCFLSSEFFPANDCTHEIILEDRSALEKTKQVETLELIAADPKIVPSVAETVLQKNQQNNVEDFNFPKFSTPTDGINFLSSSDENVSHSQNKSVEQNASVVSSITNSSNKTCIDHFKLENKFDPTQISLFIGKGLSSVLDAHYKSPKKLTASKNKVSSDTCHESVLKKRKLFSEMTCVSHTQLQLTHSKFGSCDSDKDIEFETVGVFSNLSTSFCDLQNTFAQHVNNSSADISCQVAQTINGLVNKICEDSEHMDNVCDNKTDSEILVIPETECLGLSKSVEDFLETSTLSENLNDFHVKDNLLNVSSQSRLESPVVNKIVAAVKSAKDLYALNNEGDVKLDPKSAVSGVDEKISIFHSDSVLDMDMSFLDDNDDTQELGNYKQVPYLNQNVVQDTLQSDGNKNLNFICSLYGADNEAVVDVELIVFGDIKYAFIQYKTQIDVWCQEKSKAWIRIFSHPIEDMLSLVKICMTRNEDNLVVVMLLSSGEQYCLQFLLFERDVKVIKLMENTHWLEEWHSKDSVLLCGLEGLMFASAQPKRGHEVSLHAFINLKDSPRLMTAALGATHCTLYSLCKINNLPNALMGIGDSMLYVWHILEARLVTAVSLHPRDYLPIKWCFWATVENGLIYLLTTCGGPDKQSVCQLLAANLATGFCQTAMTFSSRPSRNDAVNVTKAVYLEPFVVVSCPDGAFMWSVTEEHCCAALSPRHGGVTSVAATRGFSEGNWGVVAVGSRRGRVTCYGLN